MLELYEEEKQMKEEAAKAGRSTEGIMSYPKKVSVIVTSFESLELYYYCISNFLLCRYRCKFIVRTCHGMWRITSDTVSET
jgi:hypothetical protein